MARETVTAESEGLAFVVELDFDSGRYHAASEPPEAEFPFIAHANGKRYEIYSDGTFNEVERNPDD
jgi:hypothetical protein